MEGCSTLVTLDGYAWSAAAHSNRRRKPNKKDTWTSQTETSSLLAPNVSVLREASGIDDFFPLPHEFDATSASICTPMSCCRVEKHQCWHETFPWTIVIPARYLWLADSTTLLTKIMKCDSDFRYPCTTCRVLTTFSS